jgi:hypothetical protein
VPPRPSIVRITCTLLHPWLSQDIIRFSIELVSSPLLRSFQLAPFLFLHGSRYFVRLGTTVW